MLRSGINRKFRNVYPRLRQAPFRCVQYDLIEDKDSKGVFYMIEVWETEEHHFQHNASEHLMDFRNATSLMVEQKTEVYKGFKIF